MWGGWTAAFAASGTCVCGGGEFEGELYEPEGGMNDLFLLVL